MKQLMVISHDTYASGITPETGDVDSIASLAVGAYAIINRDPESADVNHIVSIAASTEAATPAKFQFVTMTANGLKYSPVITLKNCRVKSQAYVAPQAKVMNIAWTAGTLTVGQVAGFIVTDTTKPAHELTRNRSYEYTVVDGSTEATIVAALIALVNADVNRCVTASAGTDIVLTRTVAGKNFEVSTVGIMRGATISITTAHITGTGTAAQLIAYEKETRVLQGDHNQPNQGDLMFPAVSEVTVGETYDTYQISYTVDPLRPLINDENPTQELVVALLVSLSDNGDGKSKEGMDNFVTDINV
jgi:hypothetical protein